MMRKVITLLLAVAMTAGLCGCGSRTGSEAIDLSDEREQVEDFGGEEAAKEVAEDDFEEEPVNNDKSRHSTDGVTFGSEKAVGYDGFKYLVEQTVSTSDTESGNEVSCSVYVPNGDDIRAGEYYANGELMGVSLSVNIEPDHVGYKTESDSVAEGLKNFVENEKNNMFYGGYEYYDISVEEVETVAENMAVCEMSWLLYSQSEDECYPFYMLYAAQDMGDGVTALIEVFIVDYETTDESQAVIDELSDFYGIEIGWDSAFAEAKIAEFKDSDEYRPDAFDLGYMSFMLPEGWEWDVIHSSPSDNGYMFAPGGDVLSADNNIAIAVTYQVSKDDIVNMLLDENTAEEYVKSELVDDESIPIQDITINDVGETFIGRTVEVRIEIGEGFGLDTMLYYMGQGTFDVYGICLLGLNGVSEADMEKGQEAIDMLFETGRL